MANHQTPMRDRDKEMVPRVLVQAMFALMAGAILIVGYAQWTDRPNEGVLVEAPVIRERSIILTGERDGVYTVTDAVTGDVIAMSSDDKAGFIGVIGLVFKRERHTQGVAGNDPIRVVRRDNGHTAVIDDATGMVVELIGYGSDNVAAFTRMVD